MNRVRELREQRNMTQQMLASMASVSRPFLVDIEKNRRGAKQETWKRIADALSVTVDDLKKGDADGQAVDCD